MSNRSCILVIDDEPGVRTAIKLILESQGYSVMAVGSGHTTRKAIEMADYDAAIVDIFMPEMDGLQIITLLRKERPALPIIAVSGMISPARYSGPGEAESTDFLGMATNLGAIRALHKPFKPNDLLSAVRESIASRAN